MAPSLRPLRRIPWRRLATRAQRAFRTGRRREARFRLLRDVLGALVIVGILIGGMSLATGGAWPPVLTVESGSMMHPASETPYGRFGTIDVGDSHFVRAVDDASDVELWVDGGRDHFGRPGDVIVYAPNGNRTNTSILHRAITWVDVARLDDGSLEYRMRWLDGEVKRFGPEGIYFPPLGFDEDFGFTPRLGYKPTHSGFITKGDNAFSNPAADQALRLTAVVDPSWVEGTVHGEIPWIGLARLALRPDKTNFKVAGWERIGNAYAPIELWSCFFLVLALVILIPLSIDTHRLWREERERARYRRLDEPKEEKKPVELQVVMKRSPGQAK